MKVLIFWVFFAFFVILPEESDQREFGGIRSDVIVTKFGPDKSPQDNQAENDEEEEPGWMRRTLLKFGKLTSRVGNALGGGASKIATAVEKVCQVVKTVIPLLAAICHVGQFQFCTATDSAPQDVGDAIADANINLDVQD